MTVRLRNTSGEALYLGANGKRVEPDEIVAVEGSVDKNSPEDAYVIGDRAWPKATWTNTGGKPSGDADVTEES